LIDCGGPESISRTEQNSFFHRAQKLGQLSDGGGLARTIDPDHQNDFRNPVDSLHWLFIGSTKNGEQLFFQQTLEFTNILDLLASALSRSFCRIS